MHISRAWAFLSLLILSKGNAKASRTGKQPVGSSRLFLLLIMLNIGVREAQYSKFNMKETLIATLMLLAFCSCNNTSKEQSYSEGEDRLSNLAVVDNDAEGTQEGIKFLEDFYAGPFLSGEGDLKDFISSSFLSKITKTYYDPMDDCNYEGYDLSAFGGMNSVEPRGSVKGISRCNNDWYDVAYVDEWSGTNEIEIVKIKIAKNNGKYQIVSTDRVDEVSSSSNNSSNHDSASGSSSYRSEEERLNAEVSDAYDVLDNTMQEIVYELATNGNRKTHVIEVNIRKLEPAYNNFRDASNRLSNY